MKQGDEQGGARARCLAALSFFLAFTSGAVYLYSRGVFVRDQILDFGATRTEISLAFTIIQMVGLSFAPVLGYLVDRYPLRNVMAVGAAWLGLGFLAMSQVTSIVQFAVAGALVFGLGTGTIGTTANAKLMVNWFDRRRGLALSVAVMGYSAAGVVMPGLALHLLETMGWRSAYALFGGICLLIVLPAVASLVTQRPGPGTDSNELTATAATPVTRASFRAQLGVFLSFARRPQFWGVALTFGLIAGVYSGLNLHLFLHYTGLGMGAYEAASILSFGAALAIVSKPCFGWLVDRRGARAATLTALCLCIIAMANFSFVSSYMPLLLAGGVFGLAFGGLVPLQAALVSRLFPEAEFGRAYGSLRLCTFPVMVLCTPLIGAVYDFSGSYVPVFGLFAAMFIAAAVVANALLPERVEGAEPVPSPGVLR